MIMMNIIIFCSFFLALAYSASVKTVKRANGAINLLHTNDVGCLYNGVFEYIGSQFASLDGCNTCTCDITGIQCSASNCVTARPTQAFTGSCIDPASGQLYQNGIMFVAPDGCTRCTCTNGALSCNRGACAINPVTARPISSGGRCNGVHIGTGTHPGGNPHTGSTCYDNLQHCFHNDGDSYTTADRCNTCTCNAGILTCTNKQCTFFGRHTCTDQATMMQYASGNTFQSSDGCNTCKCDNGIIRCSTYPCNVVG